MNKFKKIIAALFLIMISGALLSQQNEKLDKADKFFFNEEYQNALNEYIVIVDSLSNYQKHLVHYYISICYYNLLNYSDSKLEIKKALKVKKSNPQYKHIHEMCYWLLGRIYSKENDLKNSEKYLIKASKYSRNSLLYSTIAYEQNRQNKFKEAIENSNKAILLNEKNPYAYNNRAYSYLMLKDYQKARIDINKSYTLDSDNPYLYKHSALIYIALGEFNNACLELNIAKQKGYYEFGNEVDRNEVNDLIDKYCNKAK